MIIDFHAHIQPGADHGCDGLETSLGQLALAKDAGVDTVVAVSHFYPYKEDLDSYLSRQAMAKESLYSALAEKDGLPRVLFGTEVALCNGLDRMEGLEKLCVEGSDCILTEMPIDRWDSRLLETLENIKYGLSLNPLLAHVDRYNPFEVEKLSILDIPWQVNIEALLPFFKRRIILKWIKSGRVSAIGSDIHKLDTVYSNFDKAFKVIGKENLSAIMEKSKNLLNL